MSKQSLPAEGGDPLGDTSSRRTLLTSRGGGCFVLSVAAAAGPVHRAALSALNLSLVVDQGLAVKSTRSLHARDPYVRLKAAMSAAPDARPWAGKFPRLGRPSLGQSRPKTTQGLANQDRAPRSPQPRQACTAWRPGIGCAQAVRAGYGCPTGDHHLSRLASPIAARCDFPEPERPPLPRAGRSGSKALPRLVFMDTRRFGASSILARSDSKDLSNGSSASVKP